MNSKLNVTGFVGGLFSLMVLVMLSNDVLAHGERAQLASMRMRTLHWFDTVVTPTHAKVGDTVTVTGKFIPSKHWPKQLASVEGVVYLNVGVPGPTFLKKHAELNGVPMMRSTSLELGKLYEYKVVLRARIPGRYHVHPLINVKDAGPVVGKGTWLEIDAVEGAGPFVNEITTLPGDVIDLETVGLGNVYFWHAVWIVLAIAYLLFWLVRKEGFIPRFIRVRSMGDEASDIITTREFVVSSVFLVVTLAVMLTGYLWAEHKYPVTIPLQTGNVDVEAEAPVTGGLEIEVEHATYELGGRNLTMRTIMTNNSDSPIRIGEFITANIRFMNDFGVESGKFSEGEEMISKNGLQVSVDVIQPGQSIPVELFASDALWETHRMTGMIHDPDSWFAGMVFYYDGEGNRYYQEIGGPVLPRFF